MLHTSPKSWHEPSTLLRWSLFLVLIFPTYNSVDSDLTPKKLYFPTHFFAYYNGVPFAYPSYYIIILKTAESLTFSLVLYFTLFFGLCACPINCSTIFLEENIHYHMSSFSETVSLGLMKNQAIEYVKYPIFWSRYDVPLVFAFVFSVTRHTFFTGQFQCVLICFTEKENFHACFLRIRMRMVVQWSIFLLFDLCCSLTGITVVEIVRLISQPNRAIKIHFVCLEDGLNVGYFYPVGRSWNECSA